MIKFKGVLTANSTRPWRHPHPGAKRPETRERRLAQAIESLRSK